MLYRHNIHRAADARRVAAARRRTWLGAALLIGALSGCASLLGIEDLSEGTPDAAPPAPAPAPIMVRGSVYGITEPITLRLEYGNGSVRVLSVSEDGPFEFPIALATGDSFAVVFVNEPSCVLVGAAGVIGTADPVIEVVCEGVYLDQLALSGPTESVLEPNPAESEYTVEVPLLQSEVAVTAWPRYPTATVAINGVEVTAGAASELIALNLGETQIAVAVTPDGGETRVYRLLVRRAPAIVQAAYSKASNTGSDDELGTSIAVSGDTLVVGAPNESSTATGVGGDQSDDSTRESGAVYVFRRTDGTWAQEAYLKASNTDLEDQFGFSVAISGNTLVVGALFEDSGATGVDGNQADNVTYESGAVYVFRRTGGAWAQEAYLKASNTGANDRFGDSIALSGDTLAVGAFAEDSAATGVSGDQADNTATNSGAAYVFRRTGGTWAQEAYLKASNTDPQDQFGVSVAVSGDTLAVGAFAEGSGATGVGGEQADNATANSGAVYVFQRLDGAWTQAAYLKPSNTDASDRFGNAVAVSDYTLAVGAYLEDSSATGVGGDQADNAAVDSGAVYIFR